MVTSGALTRRNLAARVALYTLYLAAVLALIVGAAEYLVLTRQLAPVPRDVQLSGFHAPPGLRIDRRPTNDLGFMGDDVGAPKPPGEMRILTLGGSAIFNRDMTHRLGESLRDATPHPVSLLGAALRQHTSMSSVLKYRALARYQFDYVLIYHGINDLWANNVRPDEFEEDYSHLGPWYERNAILDRSLLARRVYNEFLYRRAPRHRSPTLRSGRTDNGADFASVRTFRRNLVTLVEAVRAAGGEPVLMTFAWFIPDGYSYEAFLAGNAGYNNPEGYDRCEVELWGSQEHITTGLTKHNRVIRELADARDVLLIDQETLMGRDPRWFGDPVHLSEEGTSRFVENVTGFFVERALLE